MLMMDMAEMPIYHIIMEATSKLNSDSLFLLKIGVDQ